MNCWADSSRTSHPVHARRKGVCDLQRRSVANSRHLESLASVKHAVSLGETLKDLCKPVKLGTRRVRVMKPFDEQDTELLAAISHGEFAINGFRNKDLIARRKTAPATSRPISVALWAL